MTINMKAIKFITLSFILLSLSGLNLYGQSTFEKGYSALQDGDWEKGIDFLKMASSETPDNENVFFYLGISYEALEQYDDALAAYANAIKFGEDNKELLPEIYYYRADLFCSLQRYSESLNDYTSAITIDNKNENYLIGRGLVYSQLQRLDESDNDLNAALIINPNNIDAQLGLAVNESRRGKTDKAIFQCDGIIQNYPDIAEPYMLRAELFASKEFFISAAADIVKALELDSVEAFDSMVLLAVDAKEALSANLEKMDKEHPGESNWKYYRAIVYELNNEYKDAIELYKKANILAPSAQNNIRIASCYYAMLEYENALKYVDEAINLEPDNITALGHRCEYQYDMGDIDGAISGISKIIELDPSNSQVFFSRGWYNTGKRDFDAARMDYTKAIALDPNDANAYANRGRIFLIQGNSEAANNDFRKAVQLDNDLNNPQDAAAYALHFLGLDDEASSYTKQVLHSKEINGGLSAGDCYDAACLYSLINENEKALFFLEQSIIKGFKRFFHITKDFDLDNIRNEELFIDIMTKYWPDSIENLYPYGTIEEISSFEAPQFQCGEANDFSKWVSEQVVFPLSARNKGIQGTVILGFYVEKDGSVGDPKVVIDLDPELDAEALRVVKESPSWSPAKRNGEIIRYHYYFPLIFKLE